MEQFFVADIGGTKSDLALFAPDSERYPLFHKRYLNKDFAEPASLFDKFFAECNHQPRFGCLALAAPIRGDLVTLTNLPWQFNRQKLQTQYSLQKLLFINDLTAVSSSIPMLSCSGDLQTIQPGSGEGGEMRGIVAPGTGLGEGLLAEVDGKVLVLGSEGGHCDFAPIDQEQLALLSWMQKKYRQVSFEMLVSGTGLPNLYQFTLEYYGQSQNLEVAAAIEAAADQTRAIIAGALQPNPCPLCRRTIELFLSILGSEAGNLALKLYAKGGIYLGGGILPRLTSTFSFSGFLRNFQAKGQMADLMNDFPVYLILRSDAALLGTARYLREEMKERM